MNHPLAIVGASARAAAASAKRAGFTPITADLFADADLRAIATTTPISPYPEGFVDWMRTVEPPAFMYTGALENHPELVDQLAWIAPLWGNAGDVLERVRSPWELQRVLREAGLLFPETRPSADGLPLDGSWLSKTYRGASGSGVAVLEQRGRGGEGEKGRLRDKDQHSESPPLPLSHAPTLDCFQRRISGTPAAAVFVASGGAATLLGITQQLIGERWLNSHGFQYSGSIGPLPVDEASLVTVVKIGDVLAEQFDLIGLFGVDMILNRDGVWPIEVNPRFTASVEIVERATGVSAIELHAAACTGGKAPSQTTTTSPSGFFYGKATLFAKFDLMLSEQFAEAALKESLKEPWPTLADVSTAGTFVEAGRPILNLFAEGHSIADVEQRLRERASELERQIYGGAGTT